MSYSETSNPIYTPIQRVFNPQFLSTPIGLMISRAVDSGFQCFYTIGEVMYIGTYSSVDTAIIYDSNHGEGAKIVETSPIVYQDEIVIDPNYAEYLNSVKCGDIIELGRGGFAIPIRPDRDVYFRLRWRSSVFNGSHEYELASFYQDIEFITKKLFDAEFNNYPDI